jgi:6-pyruvoyltetrahydropterin/6-carboxytetrahydropterin synthase
MFRLSKEFRFEASHQLKDHDGKCANLHGHSWLGHLIVKGSNLMKEGPKRNMVLDYSVLTAIAIEIENQLDHKHLNDVFKEDMPTSEFIAKWVFDRARQDLMNRTEFAFLEAVTIEETCTTRCEYHAAG